MFDREAKKLQLGVHTSLCDAAGGVHQSFANAPEVVVRGFCLIVGHPKRGGWDRPGYSSVFFASHGNRQSHTRAASESRRASLDDTPWSSAIASLSATDPGDYPADVS